MRGAKTGKGHYVLLVGVSLLLLLGGVPVRAQQAEEAQSPVGALPGPSQDSQAQQVQAQPGTGEAELLHVLVGQPLEVSSPSPIRHISVSSPGVIDATLANSNQVRIDGKAPGGVSLVVQDEDGQTQIFYVYVDLKDTGSAAQSPAALPDGPAPAQALTQTKNSAWLGWALLGSLILLGGAFIKMRRQGESYKLDIGSSTLVPFDTGGEAAPGSACREEGPRSQVVAHTAVTQAEALERISQDLVEQWWRQFRADAEATVAGLREEVKVSGRVLEENGERLACLAEAKMASLTEATQEEFSMQMALALREHAHEMQATTAAEVDSIKKAAGEAVAQLEAAEDKRETNLTARAGEAENRLAGVSVALERVEGRLKSLVEGFEERIESSLQTLQGKVAKQTEDLEKLAQDLGERWSAQFQKQAEATIEKLRQEASNAGRGAEESQRELAGMFEEKLECLHQAVTRATAGLAAEQKEEAKENQRQLTSLAETKLECLNQVLLNATTGLAAQQKEWAEENQRQLTSLAETKLAGLNQTIANASAGLAAEQKKSVEESQRQLNAAVQAKVESLSQFAVSITSSVQAEHKQLQSQYETSRREFESLVSRRPVAPYFPAPQREKRPKRRGSVVSLGMAAGIILAVALSAFAIYLWTVPVMQLQAQPPAEFLDESPNWGASRRAREQEVADAYWQTAVANLQVKYPFGSELPAEPPSEFDAGKKYLPAGGAKALTESREHYWQRLRKVWAERESWVETSEWDALWASRGKRLWGQLH